MRLSPYYIPVVLGLAMTAPLAFAPAAHAQVAIGISVGIAPPPIPVYVQPPIPEEGLSVEVVTYGTTVQPVATETSYAATSRSASVPSGKSHSARSPATGL